MLSYILTLGNYMTFGLAEAAAAPEAKRLAHSEIIIRLMKKAQADIDKAFYFGCAFEHTDLLVGYLNAYLKLIEMRDTE
jgi:hypothetical protein